MSRALGITDSVTTCDCCGKSDLKCTVAIELDGGEIVHYGRVCASRNTGKSAATINSEVRAEQQRKENAARAEFVKSPEYLAERARFAARARLASPLLGMAAADFVRAQVKAADAAAQRIAVAHGVDYWKVRA